MSGRQMMTADEIRRATIRLSHEIVEKQAGTDGLLLIGIQRRGVPLARRIADAIAENEGVDVPVGALDITFYRDDLSLVAQQPVVKGTPCPRGSTVGRSSSSTMSCTRAGRSGPRWTPSSTSGARRHPPRGARRSRPSRAADPSRHVGKNVPTSREELVRVHLEEIDGEDGVEIERLAVEPAAEPVG